MIFMNSEEVQMTEAESMQLITSMINPTILATFGMTTIGAVFITTTFNFSWQNWRSLLHGLYRTVDFSKISKTEH